MSDDLDPRTPALVGAGQAAERIDDPGYRRISGVDAGGATVRSLL